MDAKAHVLEMGIGRTWAPYLRSVTLIGTDTATWIDYVITRGSDDICILDWVNVEVCPRVRVGSIVFFLLPFSNGNVVSVLSR